MTSISTAVLPGALGYLTDQEKEEDAEKIHNYLSIKQSSADPKA